MTGQTAGANTEQGEDVLAFQGLEQSGWRWESWMCWSSRGFLQTLVEGGCRRPASRPQIGSLGVCLSFPFCKVGGGVLEAALG